MPGTINDEAFRAICYPCPQGIQSAAGQALWEREFPRLVSEYYATIRAVFSVGGNGHGAQCGSLTGMGGDGYSSCAGSKDKFRRGKRVPSWSSSRDWRNRSFERDTDIGSDSSAFGKEGSGSSDDGRVESGRRDSDVRFSGYMGSGDTVHGSGRRKRTRGSRGRRRGGSVRRVDEQGVGDIVSLADGRFDGTIVRDVSRRSSLCGVSIGGGSERHSTVGSGGDGGADRWVGRFLNTGSADDTDPTRVGIEICNLDNSIVPCAELDASLQFLIQRLLSLQECWKKGDLDGFVEMVPAVGDLVKADDVGYLLSAVLTAGSFSDEFLKLLFS